MQGPGYTNGGPAPERGFVEGGGGGGGHSTCSLAWQGSPTTLTQQWLLSCLNAEHTVPDLNVGLNYYFFRKTANTTVITADTQCSMLLPIVLTIATVYKFVTTLKFGTVQASTCFVHSPRQNYIPSWAGPFQVCMRSLVMD